MKGSIPVFLFLLGALPCWGQSPTVLVPNWGPVEKILGQRGVTQGGGLKITYPRYDLNVLVQGIALEPEGALASRFIFEPSGKSGSAPGAGRVRLNGKFILMDQEVPKASALAVQNGLEITALYSPFLNESPSIRCVQIQGEGSPSGLAWALKLVLASTGLPGSAKPMATSPTTPVNGIPKASTPDWTPIEESLGSGVQEGRTLQYEFHPDAVKGDKSAFLFFQKAGAKVAAMGEFALPAEAAHLLMENLLQHHVLVTTFQTPVSTEESRMSILDFWVVGDESQVAEELKAALDQAGFLGEP